MNACFLQLASRLTSEGNVKAKNRTILCAKAQKRDFFRMFSGFAHNSATWPLQKMHRGEVATHSTTYGRGKRAMLNI